MTFIHNYNIIKMVSISWKKSLMFHLFYPVPSPLTSDITAVITLSIVFAFTHCHVVRTMQYVAFSDKLFLQSNRHSMFIYFFLEPDSFILLFLNNILVYGHTSLSVNSGVPNSFPVLVRAC